MRIEPKAWGPLGGDDPPTFLPPDALTVDGLSVSAAPATAPRLAKQPARSKSDSIITSAPKQRPLTVSRAPSQSTIKPLPPAPAVEPAAAPARGSQPEVAQRSSQPALPPFVQFEGGASFDPLAIPLPPELASPVYDWLRRLALQADLAAADHLLRQAFADLTSSLACVIIYSGPDGLHTLGATDEMPKDQGPLIAVARSRRALCTSHIAYVPIATSSETIAVVMLTRNSRQPVFNMVDQVTMAGLARESASIMHHLVVAHLQRRSEQEMDKKSLYRPEALESHRRRGQEGVVTELSPSWVRRTYWVLLVIIIVAIGFATWVQVPTYSTGTGIVVFDGSRVTAPAPGTVERVNVVPGQEVRKGDILVKLKSDKEESDLNSANKQLEKALQQYMVDPGDEQAKKEMIAAQNQQQRAADAVAQRSVPASADGTVADIHIQKGQPLEFGAPILTIVAPGTKPEVWAYMPANDLPRFKPGTQLQVTLPGFEKTPERVTVTSIGRAGISGAEAKRALGAELADALKLAPETPYVIVKGTLPPKFRAKGHEYHYQTGMTAKTEIRVESKRFIVTLLPSLEKYIP